MISHIGIEKVVISNKLPFGKQDFKYFIGSKYAQKFRPLCIFRSKMRKYKTGLDKTKYMYFLIKDEKVFDNYNEIFFSKSYLLKKSLMENFVFCAVLEKVYL